MDEDEVSVPSRGKLLKVNKKSDRKIRPHKIQEKNNEIVDQVIDEDETDDDIISVKSKRLMNDSKFLSSNGNDMNGI
jgi:hypothetical protein